MDLKGSTALKLFDQVDEQKDGFLGKDEFSQLIKNICDAGIWQRAFLDFLELNAIDLPEEVETKLWAYLNEGEENPGLVPIEKVCCELEQMIMCTGLLVSTLNTTCSLMKISVPDQELIAMHHQLDINHSGFIDYADMYMVVDKLGRNGLPYKGFRTCVERLDFTVDEEALFETFAGLDINQDGFLDWPEFRAGIATIVRVKLPEAILIKLNMSTMQIVEAVCGVVLSMVALFSFILLGLNSFGGGRSLIAKVQSGFATVITFGAGGKGSDFDPSKYTARVRNLICVSMGMAPS